MEFVRVSFRRLTVGGLACRPGRDVWGIQELIGGQTVWLSTHGASAPVACALSVLEQRDCTLDVPAAFFALRPDQQRHVLSILAMNSVLDDEELMTAHGACMKSLAPGCTEPSTR